MKPNLVALRRFAATTMTCAGAIRVLVGIGADPETGADVPIYETRWAGRLLIYPEDQQGRVVESASSTVLVSRYTLTLPVDAAVKVGDTLTVTTSPDLPELVDKEFIIRDAPLDAWAVVRQATAEQIT